MDALRWGHLPLADLLISGHSADLKAQDRTGRTALHLAAEAGQVNVVETLVVEWKVDPNVRSYEGKVEYYYLFIFFLFIYLFLPHS